MQQLEEGQKYFPNHFLTDLLMFITYPAPLWDWIHVWPFLVIRLDDTNEKEAIGRVNNSRVRSNDSEGKASKANIGRVTSLRDVPGSGKIGSLWYYRDQY